MSKTIRRELVNAAMANMAAAELYRDSADELQGTVLYRQDVKQKINAAQKSVEKQVKETHALFDGEKAELEYLLTVDLLHVFVETIKTLTPAQWPHLKTVLEAYRRGEVKEVKDEEFARLKSA